MGELIRAAREERGMSQVELAKQVNRRPPTISLIENGKSEISVLPLVLLAITLKKPISYFFPPSLLKDWIVDVKTPFEQKGLELLRDIEEQGDMRLTIRLLRLLDERFQEEREADIRGYPVEEDFSID
jgi:transcriptional regulator with XRE-family HTH domain